MIIHVPRPRSSYDLVFTPPAAVLETRGLSWFGPSMADLGAVGSTDAATAPDLFALGSPPASPAPSAASFLSQYGIYIGLGLVGLALLSGGRRR